jgi:hypothetical protein
MTKEEQYKKVLELRETLEWKINSEFLPLQREINKLLEEQNFNKYMELLPAYNSLGDQIAKEYDELLKTHKDLHVRFSMSSFN